VLAKSRLQTNEAFKRNAVPQYEGSVVPHAKRDFSAAWKQFLPNATTDKSWNYSTFYTIYWRQQVITADSNKSCSSTTLTAVITHNVFCSTTFSPGQN